jgi:hypothetical protein
MARLAQEALQTGGGFSRVLQEARGKPHSYNDAAKKRCACWIDSTMPIRIRIAFIEAARNRPGI